ncbi:MAG: HEAT repeat domain-containing protein, partial [Chloroflexia bacterium]
MERTMDQPDLDVGLFTTDEDLIIRSWNEWLARATGIRAEEAIGRPLVALFPDLEARGLLEHFRRVLTEGVVEVLAPALHRYLVSCPPQAPSRHFRQMQQRVTIVPLRKEEKIRGTMVLLEDVTARLEAEREGRRAALPEEALVEALGDERWPVRRAAVEQLSRKGEDETVRSLLRLLQEGHQDLTVLTSVLRVLTQTDADITDPLVRFLEAPDAELRTYAALALGERRDRRAVPALLRALDDPDANVRYHAIEALGKLRATEAVDRLLSIVESRDFFLAFPALDALAEIGDPAITPHLVAFLQEEMLRAPAAEVLGRLGDAGVVRPLAALLSAPGAPVRTIARSLAALYDRYEAHYGEGTLIADLVRGAVDARAVPLLLEELQAAPSQDLRPLALVLGWLEGPEVAQALVRLLGEPAVQKEVVQALVRFGPRVTALLVAQLRSEDPATRRAAAVALGRIGDPA